MTRQAVINADDFGICRETNLAIEMAFQRGILTSASLMPNMPGFDHAVDRVVPRVRGLGLGVHLVLTSGRPVADAGLVPLLVDARGMFRRSFVSILTLLAGHRRRAAREQIELELTAQLERVRASRVGIDHVDSHQHIHMIPAVWRIVSRLAARFGWPVVRLGGSSPDAGVARLQMGGGLRGSVLKRIVLAACAVPTRRLAPVQPASGVVVRHPDRLAAALDHRGMDSRSLAERLAALPEGVTEIVTHPSLASMSTVAALAGNLSRADVMFLSSPGRRLELEALMDGQVHALIARHGIVVTSFGALARPALAVAATGDGEREATAARDAVGAVARRHT